MFERDGTTFIRLVLFRGWYDPWHREVSTGFDKTGYVTTDDIVTHPRRSRIARTPLSKIEKWPHRFLDLPNLPHAAKIEAFFTQNVINNTFYVTALQQLPNDGSPFWNSPVKLPILKPISVAEHEARWQKLKSTVQKGDGIFTFDTESIVSRTIAYLDQGTWSHTCNYVGNGHIVEAIGAGVIERSIEAYHHPRFRVGAYRLPGATSEQIDGMIAFARAHVGDGYSYRKTMRLGLRLALGIWPKPRPFDTTPNMVVAIGGYELVHLV